MPLLQPGRCAMAERPIEAQRREAVLGLVKRRAAENARAFAAYQGLCDKLPTLLRNHGLRHTLDYLRMLTRGGPSGPAAHALLCDWSAARGVGDDALSLPRLAKSLGHKPVLPEATDGLLLLTLALADAEALRHACKLVRSDLSGNIPAGNPWDAPQHLALQLQASAALPPPVIAVPGQPRFPAHVRHPGIAWRFCGHVGANADDATWRQRQIQAVVALARAPWQRAGRAHGNDPHRAWYTASYNRHVALLHALQASQHTQWVGLRLRSHLFTALGERGVWDAQALLHPVSGMPGLPSSQVKNLVRRVMAARVPRMGTGERQAALQALLDDLLGQAADHGGGEGAGGLLVVHDAWWMPEDGDGPLTGDTDTNHHAAYMQGRARRAAPSDSPEPHPQLAVQGRLLFALGIQPDAGPQGREVVARCLRWLVQALAELGIGGRSTAAGAGRFETPANLAPGPTFLQ